MQPSTINQTSVFDSIYTVSELELFYKEVDLIASLLFKDSTPLETILTNTVSTEKKDGILSFLKEQQANLTNPVSIQEALIKLKTQGNLIPVVNLELAFEPTSTILKNISIWFLRRLQKKVLLSIRLERQILGGAYISFNGLYKDYTLKTKIDKYFEKGTAHESI